LHRSDYQQRALQLAATLNEHLSSIDNTSQEFATLLPVTFRLFALAGNLTAATELRRDLSGELAATAILLYNRRDYLLADQYIQYVLEGDPTNWRMRLYRARIRIRQEEWAKADAMLAAMLKERPSDIRLLHAMGWRQLREGNLSQALQIFTGIISRREHVASLRDAAECLHRMNRNPEALRFLSRAKSQESENPFVSDLESRIHEDSPQQATGYQKENRLLMRNHGFSNSSL
jgi:tetratricopeptide (TPR) repeat protein